MRALSALVRFYREAAWDAVRRALAVEAVYVEGEALGFTSEELNHIEALARRCVTAQRPVEREMRMMMKAYARSATRPRESRTAEEQLGDLRAAASHVGRLVLLETVARWFTPSADTDEVRSS